MKPASHLIIVILRSAARVEAEVEAASARNVHSLLKLVVVAHWVDCLHRLASRPGSRDLEAGEETLLFFVLQIDTGGARY